MCNTSYNRSDLSFPAPRDLWWGLWLRITAKKQQWQRFQRDLKKTWTINIHNSESIEKERISAVLELPWLWFLGHELFAVYHLGLVSHNYLKGAYKFPFLLLNFSCRSMIHDNTEKAYSWLRYMIPNLSLKRRARHNIVTFRSTACTYL